MSQWAYIEVQMKKIFLVAISLVFLAGCEDMTGELKVATKFSAYVRNKLKEIPPGNHETTLNIKKEKITATIKVNEDKLAVVLTLPGQMSLPENGPFTLTSSESGQPFDTTGHVQTNVSNTELKTGRESCQYYADEPVCNQYGCSIQQVIKNGWREIEYFDEITDQKIQFYTSDVQSGRTQSRFEGAQTTKKQKVTFEGRCY
jgi:hypothetical protein